MSNRIVRAAVETIVQPSDVGVVQPSLVTVPNIELLEVGEAWETSTGVFTFASEDLVDCIASQDDPSIRTPVIKLGHVDPRFDGQPAFGRIANLRLTNNNQTLVGDLTAMPLWLAQVMYTAFPRRSIEGLMEFSTRTGNTWKMVLTGVALLGDSYPAIDTLEDVQALWGATPPPLYPVEEVEEIAASGPFFRARKVNDDMKWLKKAEVNASSPVKAAVGLDMVRHTFYESLDQSQAWWWIREVRVNPLTLIVDDDEGGLWEVAVTVSGDDEVTFGEPSAVKVEYVAASGAPIAPAETGQILASAYLTPEETGRTSRPDPEEAATLAASNNNHIPDPEENNNMELTAEALNALGLEPGATSEDVSKAVLGLTSESEAEEVVTDDNPKSQPETPSDNPTAQPAEAPETDAEVVIPEGMVLVDAATIAELRNGVAAATGLVERQRKADQDAILDNAIRAGKFPKSRRDHYAVALSADPEGTKSLIDSLEPGLVPVGEQGEQGEEVAASAETSAYPSGWQRSVAASRRALGDRVKVIQD